MTKFEDYTARAAESLAAGAAATTQRDREFHHRAHSIYRRLIANIAPDEQRVSARADAKPVKAAAPAKKKA